MDADLFPCWVPESVKTVALGQQLTNDRIYRFLTDAMMKQVWDTLSREKPLSSGINEIDYSGVLKCYDLRDEYGISLLDQSFAALYLAVTPISMRKIVDADGKETGITVESLRNIAEPYHKILDGLSMLDACDPCWPLPVSDDVVRAIGLVRAHCEKRVAFISQKDSPYVVERATADLVIRGHVRAIAAATFTLYGRHLYGTVATIANVMFKPEKLVTKRMATNWCTLKPVPISGAS